MGHENIKGIKTFWKNSKICLIYDYKRERYITSSLDGINFLAKPKKIKLANILFSIDKETFTDDELGLDLNFKNIFNKKRTGNSSKNKYFKVPKYRYQGKEVAYYGDSTIKVAFAKPGKKWKAGEVEFEKRKKYFDNTDLKIGTVAKSEEGILVFYYVKKESYYSVGVMVFDKRNPQSLIYRSEEEIWHNSTYKENKKLINMVFSGNKLFMYWNSNTGIQVSTTPFSLDETNYATEKVEQNPILEPTDNEWESEFTFNTAAFEHEGNTHLLYRAMGKNGLSVLGHAKLKDGVHLTQRSKEPIYIHKLSETITKDLSSAFISGGTYHENSHVLGSCEDPRITKIDDKLVMTYTAFEGYPRVAMTQINVNDFVNKNGTWEDPVHLSAPGEIQKNWVIFPEKINGKYAILHNITPEIEIEYRDDLKFEKPIKSVHIKVENEGSWDHVIRGIGAPPLKTPKGWLIFYHAHSKNDHARYKLGAMLLDLNDPTKIIHKSSKPIIIPNMHYENNGFKPGIVYCCGATIVKNTLYIYYGGADTVVCAAKKELNTFLEQLINDQKTDFKKIEVKKYGNKR